MEVGLGWGTVRGGTGMTTYFTAALARFYSYDC